MQHHKSVSVVILAAGQAMRLGGGGKLRLECANQTYLEHLVLLFKEFTDSIVVAISNEDLNKLDARHVDLPCKFVEGGATRQDSLDRALSAVSSDILLLHEVARPLLTAAQIKFVLAAAQIHPVVTSAAVLPVRDTLAVMQGDYIEGVLPREAVVTLQTPQAFHLETLQRILRQAAEHGWIENSHISLAHKAGVPVYIAQGSPDNIKVTYPDDINHVEQIYSRRLQTGKGVS